MEPLCCIVKTVANCYKCNKKLCADHVIGLVAVAPNFCHSCWWDAYEDCKTLVENFVKAQTAQLAQW